MFAFPHMARSCYFLAYAASWPTHVRPTGEGVAIYRRSFPTSCDSPCDLSVKPGLLEVCVSLTSTFQGQLFHHGFASARSYAPTTHRLPVQAMGLRASCPSSIPTACFAAHPSVCVYRLSAELGGSGPPVQPSGVRLPTGALPTTGGSAKDLKFRPCCLEFLYPRVRDLGAAEEQFLQAVEFLQLLQSCIRD